MLTPAAGRMICGNRPALQERVAEVAVDDVVEEVEVLDVDRLVGPEEMGDAGDLGRGGGVTGDALRGAGAGDVRR